MNLKEKMLTGKNILHWKGRIDKLNAQSSLTDDETEELEMREAQLKIWAYQLKNAGGLDSSNPGDMSASSSATSGDTAGAT